MYYLSSLFFDKNTESNVGKRSNLIFLFISCMVITLLLFIRDVGGVYINKYIFVIICLFSFLYLNKSYFISFICFLFPLSWGMPGSYIYLFAIIFLFIKNNKSITFNQILFPLVIILMELILCINFPFFNLNSALGYFSRLALLFFLILEPKKNINYYDSIIMFIVGTIVFISIVLLATLKFVNLDLFLGGYARFGEIRDFASISSNQMALSANVNYIAYYSSVSIACILFLIVRANRHSRVLYLILLYIFFVGALTFSRAYILTICSIFFLFIIQLCHGNKKSISIIASVFLLFIGFIIFLWSHPEYVEKYLLRFNSTDGILKDSRFTILKLYFDYLYQYPIRFFFGTGILPYKYVTKISTSMHNGLQQILVGYGIFGFIFFITGLLKSIFFATRNCKKDIVSFIPLVSVVLFTQTIQFLSPTELMLPFIIGIFSLKTMDEKVK